MSLTDAQGARVEPLPPDRTPRRGGRWRDHREVIDAVTWNFQTGSQWVRPPSKVRRLARRLQPAVDVGHRRHPPPSPTAARTSPHQAGRSPTR
ncbi:transposase [Streptomyces stackebrandtii]|uniref:transposase n=1 Tax=Streptomyces stackebrandtii TaxID=3051177 RepID=UPI0037D9EC91